MHRRNSSWRAGGSVLAAVALATTMGVGVIGISASVAGAKAAPAIKNYSNKLSGNTNGWCTFAEGCNGAYNSYGTIDNVKASYSNNGGYGAHAPAPVGQAKYARVSGAPGLGFDDTPLTPATTESVTGCSRPGGEYCAGPYVVYGTGSYAVFPSTGFSTSIKIYIDTAWAAANQGQVFDSDVSLNNNTGGYLVDNLYNLCSTATGWAVSVSQNAGGCTSGPTTLTTSGWYTFEEDFTPLNGDVYVTYTVLNASGGSVFNASHPVENPNTGLPLAIAATGGPNYYWIPDEDVLGLPVADISLTRN